MDRYGRQNPYDERDPAPTGYGQGQGAYGQPAPAYGRGYGQLNSMDGGYGGKTTLRPVFRSWVNDV